MDELELRIAALELIVTEMLGREDRDRLLMLRGQLQAEAYGDEKTIRAQAIDWVDEAIRRHDEFSPGFTGKP